jgi:hypothetical protein
MKSKIFATIAIFAATLAMLGGATTVATVPAFAQVVDCTKTTGAPTGNPCTQTTTTSAPVNPGQRADTTTTTTTFTCTSTSTGDPVGGSGTCRGNPNGQTTNIETSTDCQVVAQNAKQGQGQVTGRNCPS